MGAESTSPDVLDLSSSQQCQDGDKRREMEKDDDFVPTIASGSCTDMGLRRNMEDEHLRIDDLGFNLPKPTAFYGVFDGHGGPEAATHVRENATKFFLDEVRRLQSSEIDDKFVTDVEKCLRKGFLEADMALSSEISVSSSCGTTALTALIIGRVLMVANAGDCRAVLCRKGEAVEMSHDHRPTHPSEKMRVLEMGGFVEDGYLNAVLSVTRALGDWDMKLPQGTSPLIADPEVQSVVLTVDDEFLIMGCDGIWDVLSNQKAVNLVRRGLRRHGNPQQCADQLVMEAIRLGAFDNLTVIVVSLINFDCTEEQPSAMRQRRRCCNISSEGLFFFKNLLDGSSNSH